MELETFFHPWFLDIQKIKMRPIAVSSHIYIYIPYNIKWKIFGRAQPFSPISGVCNLCTLEKFIIITKPQESTLKRGEEIFGACKHKEKVLLIPKPKRWFQVGSEANLIFVWIKFRITLLLKKSEDWWQHHETICNFLSIIKD